MLLRIICHCIQRRRCRTADCGVKHTVVFDNVIYPRWATDVGSHLFVDELNNVPATHTDCLRIYRNCPQVWLCRQDILERSIVINDHTFVELCRRCLATVGVAVHVFFARSSVAPSGHRGCCVHRSDVWSIAVDTGSARQFRAFVKIVSIALLLHHALSEEYMYLQTHDLCFDHNCSHQ